MGKKSKDRKPSNPESLSTSGRSSTEKKDVPIAKNPLHLSKPSYIASITKFREVMRSNNFKFSEILDVVPDEPTADMVDSLGCADMIKEILDGLRNQVILIGLMPYLVNNKEDDLIKVLPKEAVVFLWYKLKKMNVETFGKLNLKRNNAKSCNEDYIEYASKFSYFSGMPSGGRRLMKTPLQSLIRLSMQSSLKENETAVGGLVDRKMAQLNFDLCTCHWLQNFAANNKFLATTFSRALEAALKTLGDLILERMHTNADQENLKYQTLCREFRGLKIIEALQERLMKHEINAMKKIKWMQAKVNEAKARIAHDRMAVDERNQEIIIVSEASQKLESGMSHVKIVELEKEMLIEKEKYEQLVAKNFDEESVLRSKHHKLREKMIVLLGRVDRNMVEREEELERSNASLNIINSQYLELQQLVEEQESKYLHCVAEMDRFGVTESEVLSNYKPKKYSEFRDGSVQYSDSFKMESIDLDVYTARNTVVKI